MEITTTDDKGALASSLASVYAPLEPRVGVHISDLIAGIGGDLHMLSGRGDDEEDGISPRRHLYWALGLAWERLVLDTLESLHPGRYGRQLALSRDDIIGTLDGVDLQEAIPIECKLTWTSSRKDIRDRWAWMCQIKAYCHLIGSLQAVIYPLYINGDYSKHIPKMIPGLRLLFTQEEIESNWEMLYQYSRSQSWLRRRES